MQWHAEIRFIRPADETVRTVNPVRYFANRTWHACDITSNQRPSSHVSSHITGSPVRSSQITKPHITVGRAAGAKRSLHRLFER